MIVYRITREKYHKDISGAGSRMYGGRWNSKGIAVLYTAETRALSTLELLVHTDYDLIPPRLKLLTIELPIKSEQLYEIKIKELPENWKRVPPPDELKRIGEKCLVRENRLAIKVPSVIIPDEYNIVINPGHPDFERVLLKKIEDYQLDQRLFG